MGALSTLVNIMDNDDIAVVESATMVLGLLCMDWDAKEAAVKAKAVPALVNLMGKRAQLSTKIVAVSALMNICVDIVGKAAAVEDGAVPLIIDAVEAGRSVEKFPDAYDVHMFYFHFKHSVSCIIKWS